MAKKRAAKTPPSQIVMFRGELAFLSNFYPAKTIYEGIEYKTAEHAFQAAKSIDEKDRLYIKSAATPGDAKRMGYAIKLREDWSKVKLQIMKDCLKSKFTLNPSLRKKLLDTGELELVETNFWKDDFWGKCTEAGQNHLGKLLMEVRQEIKEGKY